MRDISLGRRFFEVIKRSWTTGERLDLALAADDGMGKERNYDRDS